MVENSTKNDFKPFIFIETNFDINKNTQPLFALSSLESRRHIRLDKEINALSLEEQIEKVKEIIVDHFKSKHDKSELGYIDPWGKIHSYKYHHGKDKIIEFSPDGTILGYLDRDNRSVTYMELK